MLLIIKHHVIKVFDGLTHLQALVILLLHLLLSLEFVFAPQQLSDPGRVVMGLEVRRVLAFHILGGSVRFRDRILLLVAETLQQNLGVACTFRPVLNDAHVLDFSTRRCDLFQNRLIAFAEEVCAKVDQLLQSQSVLEVKGTASVGGGIGSHMSRTHLRYFYVNITTTEDRLGRVVVEWSEAR